MFIYSIFLYQPVSVQNFQNVSVLAKLDNDVELPSFDLTCARAQQIDLKNKLLLFADISILRKGMYLKRA